MNSLYVRVETGDPISLAFCALSLGFCSRARAFESVQLSRAFARPLAERPPRSCGDPRNGRRLLVSRGRLHQDRRVYPLRRNGLRVFHGACAALVLSVVNGGELAVIYCFIFLYFAFAGGGPLSVDRAMLKQT